MKTLKQSVPWWFRIGVKLVLSRLRFQYSFWKRLKFFEHGAMNQPQTALEIFLEHALTAGLLEVKDHLPRLKVSADNYVVLELGPGDSLFTAVIARSLGASMSWLVDVGQYATTDMKAYTGLFVYLQQQGFAPPFRSPPRSAAETLALCGGNYLTEGVPSLAQLPAGRIDYCFSNAVLEHVPRRDFAQLTRELFRVLKPDGVSVHRVDLKDHLGGSLNHLRFSEARWEGPLFRDSGFYTNRIRLREMVGMFERAGFHCTLPRIVRWDHLPTSRNSMDALFSCQPEEELLVSGFDLVLRRGRQ